MAPCSTPGEAQTFQISRRELSRICGAGPAQERLRTLRPDAAKARSQRPQATLVTQPKIAAPCEDGPGESAERPFRFGRDGQRADLGLAPDRRIRRDRTAPSSVTCRDMLTVAVQPKRTPGSLGRCAPAEPGRRGRARLAGKARAARNGGA